MEPLSPMAHGGREDGSRLRLAGVIGAALLLIAWCASFFSSYDTVYAFAIIIALYLGVVLFYRTDLALILLVFGLYFQYSPQEAISILIPVFTLVMIIAFAAIWGVKRSAEPIVTIRLNYFGFTGRFLFLLNAFFVLSALHAEDTVETFARGVPLLLFTLFLVTLNDYFRARRRVVVFVRNFCLLGGVLAALGIVQWIIVRKQLFLFLQPYVVPQSWHDIGLKIGWKTSDLGQFKSSAIFQHQNIYGAYLASVAPLFLSLFFFHRKISLKLFYGTLFAAASLALLLSSSRGGLLNYLAGCGVLLLYVRPRHLWKFVLAGAAGFSALVYVYLDKILMLLRLQSGLSGRGQIWNYSLRMIEQSPWFGVGFLNIGDEFYSRFGPAYIVDMQLFFDKIMYTTKEIDFFGFHAHSLYLNLAVEMGVFAAVAAFVFYIVMIVRTFRFIASEKLQRWENSMAIAVMSILCGSFVHSFFDTNTLHYILIHIAVLMAIERMYIVRLVDQDFQKASLQN